MDIVWRALDGRCRRERKRLTVDARSAARTSSQMVHRNGYTIWLADFDRTELEFIVDPSVYPPALQPRRPVLGPFLTARVGEHHAIASD